MSDKPQTIHLHDIPTAVEAYLASHPSTWVGWFLMLIVFWDITSSISGTGGPTAAAFVAVLPTSWRLDAGWVWTVLGVQLAMGLLAAHLIARSTWGVHLHYALRESSFWLLVSSRERDGIGTSAVPLQSLYTIAVEVLTFLVLWVVLQPTIRPFQSMLAVLGLPTLISLFLFLVFVLLWTWVFSSVARKTFEDRSTFIAFAAFALVDVAVRVLLIDGSHTPLYGLNVHTIGKFQLAELLLLSLMLVGFAAAALTNISQSDCPTINLNNNSEPLSHLSKGLEKYSRKVSSFRVSLDHNEFILTAAKPWRGEGNQFWVVYRKPYYLPIVAQDVWFCDLQNFQNAFNALPEIRQTTADGLYTVRLRLAASPNQTALDSMPRFLENSAFTAVRKRILDVGWLHSSLGMALRGWLDTLIQQRLPLGELAAGEQLSIGQIRGQIGTLRMAVVAELHLLLPQAADHFRNLAGAQLDRSQRDLVMALRRISERTRGLLDMFDLTSLNSDSRRQLGGVDSVNKMIREMAELPIGPADEGWVDAGPNDEEFREKTADFLISVLGIRVAEVDMEFAPEMAEARSQAFAFQDSIADELRAANLGATKAGEDVLRTLLTDPAMARTLFRQQARVEGGGQQPAGGAGTRREPERLSALGGEVGGALPADLPGVSVRTSDPTPASVPQPQAPADVTAGRPAAGGGRRLRD